MGMYIYGIRSPKHVIKVKLDNGDILDVAKFAYAYKPIHSFWSKEPRWQILARARLIRMDSIWNKFVNGGGKWPAGGVLVSEDNEVSVGSGVMTWPKIKFIPTSIEDCTCNDAAIIGRVVEVLS